MRFFAGHCARHAVDQYVEALIFPQDAVLHFDVAVAGYFDGSSSGGASKHLSFGIDGSGLFLFLGRPLCEYLPVAAATVVLSTASFVRTWPPGQASGLFMAAFPVGGDKPIASRYL
jgi:hypothetical protein